MAKKIKTAKSLKDSKKALSKIQKLANKILDAQRDKLLKPNDSK